MRAEAILSHPRGSGSVPMLPRLHRWKRPGPHVAVALLLAAVGMLLSSCDYNPWAGIGGPSGPSGPGCPKREGPPQSLEVRPASLVLAVGASAEVSAVAHYPPAGCSGILVVSTATWASSNTSVATVDWAPGRLYPPTRVAGVGPGTANITATYEGKSGIAVVTVTPQS
jgi:hypothetical protein